MFLDTTPCLWANGPKGTAVLSGPLSVGDEDATRLPKRLQPPNVAVSRRLESLSKFSLSSLSLIPRTFRPPNHRRIQGVKLPPF